MSLPYGPPYPVSPLIRGARYAFLVAGFIYGVTKQRIYQAKENAWREEEAKKKIIRDRELAIEKAKLKKEEEETLRLLESGKLFEPPEGFEDDEDDEGCTCACK